MCEQCMAETKTYGEVVPHWWLVQATRDGHLMKKGDFGLVWINDPDFIWPGSLIPCKNPTFGLSYEQQDKMSDEENKAEEDFNIYVEDLLPYFTSDPETGFSLVSACDKAGYDKNKHGGSIVSWLVHKMAVVIEKNPSADEAISDKLGEEDFGKHDN